MWVLNMSGFHQRMRNMVIRQLGVGRGGKGVPITFTRRITGKYNPKTGRVDPETVITQEGSGVRVNYTDKAYRNEAIVYGDFQIYLSPVALNGEEMNRRIVGDVLTFLDTNVRIINVSPFNDNGFNCGWKLQVRNG